MTLYPLHPKVHGLIRRPRIWQALLYPLLVFILYLATTSQPYPIPSSGNDKINHVLAFVCLGVLLAWSHPALKRYRGFLLLLAYGLFIELIQSQLPYRFFSLLDLAADGVGAIAGIGLGGILYRAQRQA